MQIKTNKTRLKPFIFVLMPFHSDFDDIYQLGIKTACLSAGAYCERVDEQIFVENILIRVYDQIAEADIVIAEMTGRNPNVFYETGYAHALKKRVILLTQNSDDIPFDLKHYPHIIHGGKITYLKTELEKRIKWCIDNPEESVDEIDKSREFIVKTNNPRKPIINAGLDSGFEFLINGVTWQEALEIEIPCKVEFDRFDTKKETGNLSFSLQIGAHNISTSIVGGFNQHLGLIIPSIFKNGIYSEKVAADTLMGPNGVMRVLRLSGFRNIFPDEWDSAKINFLVKKEDLPTSGTEFILRLFSEEGAKDYKFKVDFIKTEGG